MTAERNSATRHSVQGTGNIPAVGTTIRRVEMSFVQSQDSLRLPESLESQLHAFRRLVRRIKLAEAVLGAVFGVLAAFLLLFAVDRLFETPDVVRYVLFGGCVVACAIIPVAMHRWIWKQRTLEQLARLLARRYP